METTEIRKQIYEIMEQYAPDCSEPKKMCSSFEDIVDDLAESKVKKLDIQNVSVSALRKFTQIFSPLEITDEDIEHALKSLAER